MLGKTSSEEEDSGPRHPTEEERTASWVEERFRELGLNDWQSAALADAHADWHEAKKLLEHGCTTELVVDLLT